MMRFFWILPFLMTSGCLQTENSSSQDGVVEGTAEFLAARTVFLQSCSGCHNFHLKTEEELVASGMAVAGDPEASPVYYRLRGSTGSNTDKDMPDGDSISVADVAVVRAWIESIP